MERIKPKKQGNIRKKGKEKGNEKNLQQVKIRREKNPKNKGKNTGKKEEKVN